VGHADELFQLFRIPLNSGPRSKEDQKAAEVLLKLWTSFAKGELSDKKWKPLEERESFHVIDSTGLRAAGKEFNKEMVGGSPLYVYFFSMNFYYYFNLFFFSLTLQIRCSQTLCDQSLFYSLRLIYQNTPNFKFLLSRLLYHLQICFYLCLISLYRNRSSDSCRMSANNKSCLS